MSSSNFKLWSGEDYMYSTYARSTYWVIHMYTYIFVK